MRTVTKLLGSAALVAGSLLTHGATASAMPPYDVLCEHVAGGRVPTDLSFVNWGCELTDAAPAGKERLLRVADATKACLRENFFELDLDFGPRGGGRRMFLICLRN